METKQKLFLTASLIAIFILLLLSQILEPKSLAVSDITTENINQLVKITGKITSQKNYEGKNFQVLIFKNNTDTIQVTTNAKAKLELNYSKTYAVIGKVTEYNRTLQIAADKIYSV
ncbi:MAG: hypothetical protein AABX17_02770 [Nanoarchaeota archaeon]